MKNNNLNFVKKESSSKESGISQNPLQEADHNPIRQVRRRKVIFFFEKKKNKKKNELMIYDDTEFVMSNLLTYYFNFIDTCNKGQQ